MKRAARAAFCLILALLVSAQPSFACTTFCLKNNGEVLFGKNYDWMIGDGMLFVNKRGVAKTASAESSANPAKWTSKYGSVTFNQYGRENPSGGMNEAGLVIELMWLDDTQWPKPDQRPTVGTLEWIQYQLDTSATADEVIRNADHVRIASEVKLHYLVNDKAGSSAVIEFLDGKLVSSLNGMDLHGTALANDTLARSRSFAAGRPDGGERGEGSLERFSRAAAGAKRYADKPRSEAESVTCAFGLLADVAQKNSTQWSIVYDQKRAKIHFKTRAQGAVKTIDARGFDYSCASPVRVLDIDSAHTGDVTAMFTDYTRHANRGLIERAFNGTPFLKGLPGPIRDAAASYAEEFPCENEKRHIETKRRLSEVVSLFDVAFPILHLIRRYMI